MRERQFRLSIGVWSSLGVHVAVALLFVLALSFALRRPERLLLPGTPAGQRLELTYSPGGQRQTGEHVTAPKALRRIAPQRPASKPLTAPVPSPPQLAETGPGASGPSGLGDGDIKIALPQFNPRPEPDLSGLPHGTSGSVIVDVVIDTAGKVTQLTLVKGLGGAIDNTVLQTVHTWVFTPATRDGQVIASEQEILVHYERG